VTFSLNESIVLREKGGDRDKDMKGVRERKKRGEGLR
jgi:hypothetical protein